MTKISLLLILVLASIGLACKQEKKAAEQRNQEIIEDTLKDISELTYVDIFYLLHKEEEYGMDVHGDMFGQEAISSISLINSGSTNCGDAISITNSHPSNEITAAVRTTFSFPANPANEMFRAYVVKPGETTPVGHSMLCYKGNEYQIDREIVSAGFTEQE